MKKNCKLLFVCIFMLCVFFGFAENDSVEAAEIVQSGICGDNATWTLDDSGTLTVDGSGRMHSIDSSSYAPWYEYRLDIQHVVIGEEIAGITGRAFQACINLQTVTFAEGTVLDTIGSYAFNQCESLVEITIPATVQTIGESAFLNCFSLENVHIEEGSVLYLIRYNAFANDSSLTEISIPAGVKTIEGSAFRNCSALSSVLFEENSNLEKLGSGVFSACTALTEITIPAGVKELRGTFSKCSGLTEITFAENSVLNYIGGAFYMCEKLNSVTIPATVQTIQNQAFYGSGIETIYFEQGSSLVSIGDEVFSKCAFLKSVTFPQSLESIGEKCFTYANALEQINVEDDNVCFLSDNGVLYTADQSRLIAFPINHSATAYSILPKTKTIDAYAFMYNKNMTAVTLPEGLESIGEWAFWYSESLVEVTIPSTVAMIGSRAFADIQSLVTFSFAPGCVLTQINREMCSNCENLTAVQIPASVRTIGRYAFNDCNNLQSVTFETGSVLENIEEHAFADCYPLQIITIPKTVKTLGTAVFYFCQLREIVFEEGSCVESLGNHFFTNLRSLERVVLPASLKSVGSFLFGSYGFEHYYRYLKEICFQGTEEQWNSIEVAENNDVFLSIPVVFDYDLSKYENISQSIQNGVLTITGEGETPSSTNPSFRLWNEYREETTAVVLDGDFTVIGKNTFADFLNLTYLVIASPDIVIEDGAFNNCPLLETVILFGNSDFGENAFVGCAEQVRIFEDTAKTHTCNESTATLNIVPFSCSENTLTFDGELSLDSYEFFDILSAFATYSGQIDLLKVNRFSFEDIVLYYYDEANQSLAPIQENTLENGEIYPQVFDGNEIVRVSYNTLCNGIADGSITQFFLTASDEEHEVIEDTQVQVRESFAEVILRALRWIVTVINKLFQMLKGIFG